MSFMNELTGIEISLSNDEEKREIEGNWDF
jgi:hypothetical protein